MFLGRHDGRRLGLLRDRSDGRGRLPDAGGIARRSSTRARACSRARSSTSACTSGSLTFDDAVAALSRSRRHAARSRARRRRARTRCSRAPRSCTGSAPTGCIGSAASAQRVEGASFSLRRFHDRLLVVRIDSGAADRAGVRMSAPPADLTACTTSATRSLRLLVVLACAGRVCAARGDSAGAPPSNDLLIVGYDREPDTLNRFSTHILEDIQTCVVEGLTTTDEQMKRGAAARGRGADARERRRAAPAGRRHGRHLEAAARRDVARRHAVHVRRREVHRRRDQRPELQPREHRRLRSHQLGRHAGSADGGRALQGDLRAVRHPVHPRHCCRSTCSRGATSIARRTTTATRSAPGRTASPSGRPANTSCSSACRTTGAATSTRGSAGCCSSSSRTRTRASTS